MLATLQSSCGASDRLLFFGKKFPREPPCCSTSTGCKSGQQNESHLNAPPQPQAMGSSTSVKRTAQKKVNSRVKKSLSSRPVQVGKPGGGVKGRQRGYISKSSAHDVLFLGAPADALTYPDEGPLTFLSSRDLSVIPMLSREFFDACGGNVETTEREWMRKLFAARLPDRAPLLLQEICSDSRKVRLPRD